MKQETVSVSIQDLEKLESIVEYHFKQIDNIIVAMVHPGTRRSDKNSAKHFERLEFLGDRVLGLSLASLIYAKFKEETEGELAVRMSILAGTEYLIEKAKSTSLIDCFCYPKDVFVSKHKTSSAIADMMEAVLGSVFLDSDLNAAKGIVERLWGKDLGKVMYKIKDPKTRLQEITQSRGIPLPVYKILGVYGESHDPTFDVEVEACGQKAVASGNSKKAAEHDAAEKLLAQLDLKKLKPKL